MKRLVGPCLASAADAAEVLHRELDANPVFSAELEQAVDAFGFLFIVDAALLVLDVPEIVAEPDADVVAAVRRQAGYPRLHPAQRLVFAPPRIRRRDHVQPDRDVRLTVGEFQVTVIPRADPHSRAVGIDRLRGERRQAGKEKQKRQEFQALPPLD